MSKSDGEKRFGNPAELHGTKVQIPYLTTEKNSFKRMDDEDKQVKVSDLARSFDSDLEASCRTASCLLPNSQQILPSGTQLQTWK